jgi:3-dehydroquinate synthetase/mannose-6-phosphate isomerase-like protein (cupin superfamily)
MNTPPDDRRRVVATPDSGLVEPESGLVETGVPPHEWSVRAHQTVSYEVQMVHGVLEPENRTLIDAGTADRTDRPRRFIVVDATIYELHGAALRRYLDHHNCHYDLCVLPASEETKTMDTVFTVVSGLNSFGISRRNEPIIGIGGGVLLDIVGLASSLYRRSTPYVRVPTSLIGLVDAGVGVKTGVNFECHKNRLGTYFASSVALLDRSFLATLDDRHISNGMAEVLKIGLVKDSRLFQLLDEYAELLLTERLVGKTPIGDVIARNVFSRAVGGMLEELQPNLWEKQLERVVDYGHSFSPTLEMQALPALLHGEAVSIDMALTTVLAEGRGLVSSHDRKRIFDVIRRLRLPIWHPLCEPRLLGEALHDTARHRDGLQRIPLPVGIGGACFVNDLTVAELTRATEILFELDQSQNLKLKKQKDHMTNELIVADVNSASEVHDMHCSADVVKWKCLTRRLGLSGTWEAIEWSSLPPGAVCVERRHTRTEELYFILSGEGELLLNDVPHQVRPGHLIANGLGTKHRFQNLGTEDLNWLVIEVCSPAAAQALSSDVPTRGGVA